MQRITTFFLDRLAELSKPELKKHDGSLVHLLDTSIFKGRIIVPPHADIRYLCNYTYNLDSLVLFGGDMRQDDNPIYASLIFPDDVRDSVSMLTLTCLPWLHDYDTARLYNKVKRGTMLRPYHGLTIRRDPHPLAYLEADETVGGYTDGVQQVFEFSEDTS